MYYLTKLSVVSINYLDSFNGTAKAKTNAFSFALACALINSLQDLEALNPEIMGITLKQDMTQKVTLLNELLRLDPDKVLNYMDNLYLYRFRKTNCLVVTASMGLSGNPIADFFGISKNFCKEDIEMICQSSYDIVADMNKLDILLRDLGLLATLGA